MEWSTIGTEVLKLAVWTVAPIALALAANLARVYARRLQNALWREMALQAVAKVEALAQGRLKADEKLALAIKELADRGVPAPAIHGLIEWAVLQLTQQFDLATAKRERREAIASGS